jgi:uncharacterized membrane protein YedE/YeeE
MNKLISLIAGIIFGIGLVVSEMVNPAKVLGVFRFIWKLGPLH